MKNYFYSSVFFLLGLTACGGNSQDQKEVSLADGKVSVANYLEFASKRIAADGSASRNPFQDKLSLIVEIEKKISYVFAKKVTRHPDMELKAKPYLGMPEYKSLFAVEDRRIGDNNWDYMIEVYDLGQASYQIYVKDSDVILSVKIVDIDDVGIAYENPALFTYDKKTKKTKYSVGYPYDQFINDKKTK